MSLSGSGCITGDEPRHSYAQRSADKPLCHTKAEGVGGKDGLEKPLEKHSTLKKVCRVINHLHLPLKLDSIHYHGLEFILLILCPWGGPSAAAAQHVPGLAHHRPCAGMCFGRKDRLRSAPLTAPLSTLRNSISYEDFIHFLLFFFLFIFKFYDCATL